MYLAAHSINQVLYGWQLGIWSAFAYYYLAYRGFKQTLTSILRHDTRPTRFCLFSFILFCGLFVISLVTYFAVDSTFSPLPIWEARLLDKCGVSSSPAFTPKSFTDSGSIFLYFGASLGISFEQRFFYNVLGDSRWNRTVWWKGLLRLVVLVVALVIVGLPYLLVKYDSLGLAGYYIFRMALSMFLIGFVLFGLTRRLMLAMGLAERGDNDSSNVGRPEV